MHSIQKCTNTRNRKHRDKNKDSILTPHRRKLQALHAKQHQNGSQSQKLDLETTLKATTLNHLLFINLGINLSTNSN